MKRGTLLVPAVVATAACVPRTTVRQTIAQRVETREAVPSMVAPADFVAAIPALQEGGRCDAYAVSGGGRLVVLSFEGPGGIRRNVGLQYDASGTLVNYSDLRGALDGSASPETSITIGFGDHQATAVNENTSEGTQGLLFARADEVMDLPNLGNPRQMIETVKAKCGT